MWHAIGVNSTEILFPFSIYRFATWVQQPPSPIRVPNQGLNTPLPSYSFYEAPSSVHTQQPQFPTGVRQGQSFTREPIESAKQRVKIKHIHRTSKGIQSDEVVVHRPKVKLDGSPPHCVDVYFGQSQAIGKLLVSCQMKKSGMKVLLLYPCYDYSLDGGRKT